MKRILLLLVCCSFFAVAPQVGRSEIVAANDPPDSALTLWYTAPASKWVEALPIGNGRLGAMVFGGVADEKLQFNEDTVWNGEPHSYAHKGAVKYLAEIRSLLEEGKQREAEKLAGQEFMGVPMRQRSYQAFGDILLHFPGHENVTAYQRELDLDEAIARVRYKVGDVTFTREVFSTAVDQVLVARITADKPGQVSFTTKMTSLHKSAAQTAMGKRILVLKGDVEGGAINFEARLMVKPEGGEMTLSDEVAEVKGADAVTLLLVGATNFVRYNDVSADPAKRCAAYMRKVVRRPFEKLRTDHIADHQSLFRRVKIDLGTSPSAKKPTNLRIESFATTPDPELASLYYQFGRYLMIASSRPGAQPANLQGLWNDSLKPSWDSKYTVNINTEMNYWMVEAANLSECHDALFGMLKDISETGAEVAKEHYGAGGWVLHHNTDIWRGAAPINASNHGIWPTGGAWLSQHLMFRYEFTRDKKFLAETGYPLLKGAAQFFVDALVRDKETGWLISTPSNSPENGGLVAGPTMDHMIIRELFANTIYAAEELGVDEAFRKKLAKMKTEIAPNQIGKYGQLQEWLEDKDNPNNHHRHVSHMWGLHPGREIDPITTPKLADAARVTLAQRGDDGTGWSLGWKVNIWARLHDAEHSYKLLAMQLTPRRTYPNLFDAHPPFQIDGNFGATSGINEMLLQSQTRQLHLLPALPSTFATGSISGLRAVGAFEVDLAWAEGKLKNAKIKSLKGQPLVVRYGDLVKKFEVKEGDTIVLDGTLSVK